MNIKTLLLYAAIACGAGGAGALALPYLTSSNDIHQAVQENGESGNIQRKGRPPIITKGQEF